MPQDLVTSVSRNLDLGHGSFLLEFEAPAIAASAAPGQFLMVGIPGAEILLRRPFSVCGLPGTFDEGPDGSVQILYRVTGRGTNLLGSLKAGARLDVLGPLGQGFTRPGDPAIHPVFVAGGIGSAPFPALGADLRRRGFLPAMFYGARSRADLPLLEWFSERLGDVHTATEDGSLGAKGLVTEPLERWLDAEASRRLMLYVCGPEPMLRAVARIALARGIDCELSLEAHMACGFGVCLGCVVPTRAGTEADWGYERVCAEGPVMRAERLAW
jgi:dihydroorotate dehydrogenase electron transfer subunit